MTAVLEPPAVRAGKPEVIAAVEAFRAGDSDAFGVIYRHYRLLVIGFVQKRIDGRQPQLAEDLTADVFERAFKRLARGFTWQGSDLGAWLVTIARNLIADYYKAANTRLTTVADLSFTGITNSSGRPNEWAMNGLLDRSPEGRPAETAADRAHAVILAAAVKSLSPEQRRVLVLRFYEQMPVAEVAEIMGKNEGAVKALQYRAVRALARALPEGFEPW